MNRMPELHDALTGAEDFHKDLMGQPLVVGAKVIWIGGSRRAAYDRSTVFTVEGDTAKKVKVSQIGHIDPEHLIVVDKLL